MPAKLRLTTRFADSSQLIFSLMPIQVVGLKDFLRSTNYFTQSTLLYAFLKAKLALNHRLSESKFKGLSLLNAGDALNQLSLRFPLLKT